MEWNENDVQPEQPAEESQELRPAAEPVVPNPVEPAAVEPEPEPVAARRQNTSPSPWLLSPSPWSPRPRRPRC